MKRYFYGTLALAAGIAASAFTIPTSNVAFTWYHFNGNATNPADLANPAKYVMVATPLCATTTSAYRCDILIESNPSNPAQPDLSQPVQQERKRTTPQ